MRFFCHAVASQRQRVAILAIDVFDDMLYDAGRLVAISLLVLPHGVNEMRHEARGGIIQNEWWLLAVNP